MAGFDFCRRLVLFLKEDSGQVAGSFSWGQASCMNLEVLNNKILKKGTSLVLNLLYSVQNDDTKNKANQNKGQQQQIIVPF